MDPGTRAHLIGRLADAIGEMKRTGQAVSLDGVDHLLHGDDAACIWSDAFEAHYRRQRPWWKRIFSLPSPDNRPGGPWR